jgi:hypothetical protein
VCSLPHYPRCPERRLPYEPLKAALAGTGLMSSLSASTRRTYEEHGVPESVADRLAVRAGHHPSEIWPEWAEIALSPTDRQFLSSGWRQTWLWRELARDYLRLPLDCDLTPAEQEAVA